MTFNQELSTALDWCLFQEQYHQEMLRAIAHYRTSELEPLIGTTTTDLPRYESPIERMFGEAAQKVIPGLISQLEIGPYRVDFAIPKHQLVIELDGHEYHKTKWQRTYDAERERYIELAGWRVIRFTGTEIFRNVNQCVRQVTMFIHTQRRVINDN